MTPGPRRAPEPRECAAPAILPLGTMFVIRRGVNQPFVRPHQYAVGHRSCPTATTSRAGTQERCSMRTHPRGAQAARPLRAISSWNLLSLVEKVAYNASLIDCRQCRRSCRLRCSPTTTGIPQARPASCLGRQRNAPPSRARDAASTEAWLANDASHFSRIQP